MLIRAIQPVIIAATVTSQPHQLLLVTGERFGGRNRFSGMPILVLFALCWSGVVLLIDTSAGHQYYQQFESGKFPSVTGTITHSELQTHNSKGNTYYTAIIHYIYTVNGHTFAGDRLAFSEDEPTVSELTIANTHPVGSAVQVYYNPGDPNESLLYPGVTNNDLAWVLFLTPFNIVMIGFWTWIGGQLRYRVLKPVAGGVRIIADGKVTRVRLPRWEAIWWGLVTTGGLGFVFTIVVGMGAKMYPIMAFAPPIAGLVFLAGIGAYVWRCLKARTGNEDLIIDEVSGTLELPLTFKRKERVTVGFSEIKDVWVDTIVQGGNRGTTYAPTLSVRGQSTKQRLAEWPDRLKAEKFTEWLCEKTRISSQRT